MIVFSCSATSGSLVHSPPMVVSTGEKRYLCYCWMDFSPFELIWNYLRPVVVQRQSHLPICPYTLITWWRHQMETFSALLAICAGNSPVPGEFPSQRPGTRSFDVFLRLRLNKRLSKQSIVRLVISDAIAPLWRHRNDMRHIGHREFRWWRVTCVCYMQVNKMMLK